MNYIGEVNSFYNSLEINPLSSSAINLWHALLHLANKAHWADKFTVRMDVLECKTSLKKKTIERARNELQQKGYITWRKRAGNQSAEYKMKSLCVKNNPQPVSQPVPQDVPQPVAIIINKTKQNIIEIGGQEFFVFDSLKTIYFEFVGDTVFLEPLCMNNSVSPDDLHLWIVKYFAKLSNEGVQHTTLVEVRRHFANWLRSELEKARKQKGQKHGKSDNDKKNYGDWGQSVG